MGSGNKGTAQRKKLRKKKRLQKRLQLERRRRQQQDQESISSPSAPSERCSLDEHGARLPVNAVVLQSDTSQEPSGVHEEAEVELGGKEERHERSNSASDHQEDNGISDIREPTTDQTAATDNHHYHHHGKAAAATDDKDDL
ncbi:hypothetical protein EV182_005166, partial [Spiromyces aspiralis]